MKMLVLADIDDLHWQGGIGRADVLLALGDMADTVILEAAEAWQSPAVLPSRATTMPMPHSRSPSTTCTCAPWSMGGCASAV
jgi:hypothetical protein